MKHYQIILCSLLIGTVACSKAPETTDLPEPKSSITLDVDYEPGTYELGKTIEATLTVTENNATGDSFLLKAFCYGGKALGTIEGEELEWNSQQSIPYEIINETFSSKVLHIALQPVAGEKSSQSFTFDLQITSSSGTLEKARIYINSLNSADIIADLQHDSAPIELEEMFEITLSATKENFIGNLSLTAFITEGNGFFKVNGEQFNSGKGTKFQPGNNCKILYQPMTRGSHKINLKVSDDVSSIDEFVEVEVYNQGGISKPENGIYIYTSEGLYFSLVRWDELADKNSFTPEGVAIITDETKFILAPERSSGFWANGFEGPEADYVTLIPEILWTKDPAIAKMDYDGRKNTEALLKAYEDGRISMAHAARYCYNYDPKEPGKWYLPAAGQMNLIVENIKDIQKCLKIIGGMQFEWAYMNYSYLSSTGCNKYYAWCMDYYNQSTPTFSTATISRPAKYYPVRDL